MQERPAALIDANVIVVGEDHTEPYTAFSALVNEGNPHFVPPERIESHDLLNIQYTSGTTGFPKGCMQHQRYWIVLGATVSQMAPDVSSLLTDHPYFYMDPQWQLVWCLYGGVTDHVAARMSSTRFWDRIRKHNIEWAWFPTPILKLSPGDSDKEHTIKRFHVGAISEGATRRAEARFGVSVRGGYGMTEIGAGTLVPEQVRDDEILGTVGLRAPFRELKIVDEHGDEVAPGEAGELVVRGDGVFLGYYNKPDANKNSFYDDWFRTGDMFVRTENAYYKIVGRFKDMIRRSSENISAMEVEHVVCEIDEIEAAAVVPVPDDYRGEEVKVYVKLIAGIDRSQCTPEIIIEHCHLRLADFKEPRFVAYSESFPYTPSDKIAKHALIADVADLRLDSYDRKDSVWR
jgi:crotonobetaine/carnitine-CoA ligase